MKRKGFTLIELLAVIVILAIIAVIATPIITNIIEDSKKAAFNRSVEGIIKGLEFDVAFKLDDNGYTYTITDGDIEELEGSNISISNTKGYSGTVRYDSDANVSYAIHNDKWCVIKVGNDINTIDYVEGECVISISTPETCFTTNYILESFEKGDNCENYFISDSGMTQENATTVCNGGTFGDLTLKDAIELGYLDIEELQTNNVIKNAVTKDRVSITNYDINTCGVDIVIPSKINNKEVVAIGNGAFASKVLSTELSMLNNKNNIEFISNKVELVNRPAVGDIKSVIIPDTVKTIGEYAFSYNQIKNLVIGNGVTTIGEYAFSENNLTSVIIPATIKTIGDYSFYKSSYSNPNLTKIINKIDKSFDWGSIVNGTSGYNFKTGIVVNDAGNVEITSE